MHQLLMALKEAETQFLHRKLRETVPKRFVLVVLEEIWKFPNIFQNNFEIFTFSTPHFLMNNDRQKKRQLRNRMQQMS